MKTNKQSYKSFHFKFKISLLKSAAKRWKEIAIKLRAQDIPQQPKINGRLRLLILTMVK